MNKVALVTGANRGLGFELVRKLALQGVNVILSSRDEIKGREAVDKLSKMNLKGMVLFHKLDVTRETEVKAIYDFVIREFGKLDILINNAGILPSWDSQFLSVDLGDVRKTLEVNTLGALGMCQVFLPLMIKNGFGRVVNVSSGMGSLSEMTSSDCPDYRISKTAMNAVTCLAATQTQGRDILVNSVSPGWVRTDMGTQDAPLSVEEGADNILFLAFLPKGGPSGKFFKNKKESAW